MPEQKMTYQERFKAAAKKHADRFNQGGRREFAGGPILKNDPEHMMDEAEVTVAAQAEAIRQALMWAYEGDGTCQSLESHSNDIDNYLQEHGYVEPKTEEDGKM